MAVAQTTTIFSSAIIIVLFSSSIVAHTSGDVGGKPKAADFVTEACKNATANYDKEIHLTEKFCVSTLRSDNQSGKAKDLHDLALIGVDILKARVVTANGKVQEMLHKAKSGMSRARRLTFCKLDYDVTDYRGADGGDNDGPPSFMLPHSVEQVNILSGYCGHELLDMPGLHALFNENLD
ncbi:hypothetical protein CFC21_106593 [Triticum aestivum]|uniref:Pectinesterase inhibitor domain-containing protein n=4 Tax=Triticinae TaxID=1648030 RepID=A0A453QM27_AEGTS|nr:uncharacterized protein LOC120968081 [Aegilops tauschii subsp. strangulata]KAF7105818.1 hypothetical protein CFC21_106593 [Triticum aestivum]